MIIMRTKPDITIAAFLFALVPLLALSSCQMTDRVSHHDNPPTAPTNQDERMAWWREARFGMFIHWGLYAIPAGKWDNRDNHGEWIRTTAEIPRNTYQDLQPLWDPANFDADAWAQMAKAAGMKYIVITSKHHDGFCLFDSLVSEWDIGNTPHKRDIMKELSSACRRHGIKFCTYHSIMDWHHPDYLPRRNWEKDRPTEGADFDRFEEYLHAQVTEVITRYRPAVMWFDGEWESTWTHERGVRLFELCRKLAPEMIVNNRVDVHRQGMQGFSASDEAVGDFDTPEQEIPATGLPGVDWESCMTMNGHWGWNAADTRWKSDTELIQNLIDIASKGGNYLLNIGPRADGTFPPQAIERLARIGQWMDTNEEAIRGTTASIFESLPFGRCTVRPEPQTTKLYLHVFDWPENGTLFLPGLDNAVARAFLLSNPEVGLATSPGKADASGVVIQVPEQAPDKIATVVVVEVHGKAKVFTTPSIRAATSQFVTSLDISVPNNDDAVHARYTIDDTQPIGTSKVMPDVLQLNASTTLKVAFFQGDRQVSSTASHYFEQVTPLPAVKALAHNQGLRKVVAGCNWQVIPNDRSMFDKTAETIATIFAGGQPAAHSAHRYTGFLSISETDLYRFALTSDDGSKLWIDGQLVVDNDGLHGPVQMLGSIALARGLHSFELIGFNATGGAALDLQWAKSSNPLAALPAAALRH